MMATQPGHGISDVRPEAFPVLTDEQISRLRPLGTVRAVERGEILVEPNQAAFQMFVVLSGRLEIFQTSVSGELAIVTHEPSHFSGEMTMISGQRSLMRARVAESGEFLEVSGNALRSLIAQYILR